MSPVAEVEGLAQHEMVTLVAIAENLDSQDGAVPVLFGSTIYGEGWLHPSCGYLGFGNPIKEGNDFDLGGA